MPGYYKTIKYGSDRPTGRFSKNRQNHQIKGDSQNHPQNHHAPSKSPFFEVKMLYLGRFWADFFDFFDFFEYNCHSELIEIRFGLEIHFGLEICFKPDEIWHLVVVVFFFFLKQYWSNWRKGSEQIIPK